MKKLISNLLCFCMSVTLISFTACTDTEGGESSGDNVLRVGSWDEYIDEGSSFYEDPEYEYFRDWYMDYFGIDLVNTKALYEEFEDYYKEKTGKEITVEYIPLQDNETMYNKIKMGDDYDLLCPSEYMMMKLKAEDRIQPLPDSLFDETNEDNHYIRNVSPYIKEVFEKGGWSDYIAGYMWGTTGFVFNTEMIQPSDIMSSWHAFTSPVCERNITAKDNARDSYFVGLGLYYEDELLSLKEQYENKEITLETYQNELDRMMNDTSDATIQNVKEELITMRSHLYGLETDEGKLDVATGRLGASYQWSGDAVFILDEADRVGYDLEYQIPTAASNLWFDGWTLMKGASEETAEAAAMFINFLSMPQNVIRNMFYIGYTSCIGGDDVYAYVDEMYGATEEDTDIVDYPLDYFFGAEHTLSVPISQTRKQLFAQYPDENTIDRLVVMRYFDKEANEKVNRMWCIIK